MYFLMPPQDRPLFDVFPDQDHKQHIAVIDEFLNGPFAEEITKDMLPAIQNHRMKHIAFLYMQNQIRLQNGQGRTGIMGEESNNQENYGTPEQAFQTEGQGDVLSGIGLEEIAGAMGSSGDAPQDNVGSETGFLNQLLPK